MPRRPRTKAARTEAVPAAGEHLTEAQKAQVWVLRDENRSYREIAKEVGCGVSTVHRVLKSDPARLEEQIAHRMQIRADQWQVVEDRSLRMLLDMIDTLELELAHKRKRAEKVALAREWAPTLRLAAAEAATKTQLLSNRATERIESTSQVIASEMSPEEVVRLAVESGIEHELPPLLSGLLRTMRSDGRLPPKPEPKPAGRRPRG